MSHADWLEVDRLEFRSGELLEATALPDPIEQFRRWWEDLKAAGVKHPDQMTLATATPAGKPSARIVLLKAIDERGFVFVTNYDSRKGREAEQNPHVALCFYWEPLERQVRIEGTIERLEPEKSLDYYHSRPRAAQLGAWASPQSREIPGREVLESGVAAAEQRFAGAPVPLPPNWGGFRVVPQVIEFWQGRESRLHDRLVYRSSNSGASPWTVTRLAP